jgi:hypothetical protein
MQPPPLPESFAEVRAHLIPIVRTSAQVDIWSLMGIEAGGDPAPAWKHVVADLHATVAFDTPEALVPIPARRLARWGVALDEVLGEARSCLADEPITERVAGLFEVAGSGRLLRPDLLGRLRLHGAPIAMVPGGERLLVAGSQDTAALVALVDVVDEALREPRPGSAQLVRLRHDSWVPFELPPGHPAARRHAELALLARSGEYAEQKKALDRVYAKTGKNIFVANHAVVRAPDQTLLSWCAWTPAVSSLPESDLIGFVDSTAPDGDPRRSPLMVAWRSAIPIVGPRMRRDPELRLTRHLVDTFPSDDELAALAEKAARP